MRTIKSEMTLPQRIFTSQSHNVGQKNELVYDVMTYLQSHRSGQNCVQEKAKSVKLKFELPICPGVIIISLHRDKPMKILVAFKTIGNASRAKYAIFKRKITRYLDQFPGDVILMSSFYCDHQEWPVKGKCPTTGSMKVLEPIYIKSIRK